VAPKMERTGQETRGHDWAFMMGAGRCSSVVSPRHNLVCTPDGNSGRNLVDFKAKSEFAPW
jgi:hypothetical protein